MSKAVDNVGMALGQHETETILGLYAAVQAGDLATGAELAGGGAVSARFPHVDWFSPLNRVESAKVTVCVN